MKMIKNQLLLKDFIKRKNLLKKNFVKLNTLLFNFKNSSFILGKRNNIFFYKIEKLILLLNEVLYFYLNFFYMKNKNLFVFEKKLIFLFGKEACLRSFQTIFFGIYNGGIFMNNLKRDKYFCSLLERIDIISFVFVKKFVLSFREISFLKKPCIVFSNKIVKPELTNSRLTQTKLMNYVFYKIFFEENLYFFYYFVFKLFSDLFIKIQIYNYIQSKILD